MPEERDPIEIAARALRHRDRSRHEIDGRLERAGVEADARADALDTLERVGYVDDARFAAARAAAVAARGYGDDWIRHDLERHGIAAATVEDALAALEPEAARARVLAAHLGSSAKTWGRLARKGFSAESLETALGVDVAEDGNGELEL